MTGEGGRGRVVAYGRSTADGGPVTLVVVQDSGGWVFHGPDGPGVRLGRTEAVRLCGAVLDRSMIVRPFERWLDAEGIRVGQGCWVEQVGVHKTHGAALSRLGRRGQVWILGHSRVGVLFEGEDRLVTVRPHLLRVITRQAGGGEVSDE